LPEAQSTMPSHLSKQTRENSMKIRFNLWEKENADKVLID
jgi:hypothetical protein